MTTISKLIKNALLPPANLATCIPGPHKFNLLKHPLWILMYHRILPPSDPRYANEEPGMIVEPETFRQHLKLVKQYFTPMHLSEWIARHQQGLPLPRNACAITFDDGWCDNFEFAYPVIQEEQVPITLFAVSEMIGTKRLFWPNQIINLLKELTPEDINDLPWLKPYLGPNHNSRETAAYAINQLKQFSDTQIFQWLDAAHTAIPRANDTGEFNDGLMSWAQLREMSQNNLVEIGSHTSNHYRLNDQLPENILEHEITSSKYQLQEELGQPIDLFCYPNGDTCRQAEHLVQKNYKAAVTTEKGINTSNHLQPHRLKRIGLHQDRSETKSQFNARLANWY